MSSLRPLALIVAAAALAATAHQTKGDPEPFLDGRTLEGYESAVAYLRKDATKERPLVLGNYGVAFEKGFRYYFQVWDVPGERPYWPGLSNDRGTTVRVYVDPKTLRVTKAVVE